MKTKKIIAVQVDPEYQESPLNCYEMFSDNVAVFGNDRMNEHIPERCEKALAALRNDGFWYDLEIPERAEYTDAADVLGDWLPRENGAAYNADECRAFTERFCAVIWTMTWTRLPRLCHCSMESRGSRSRSAGRVNQTGTKLLTRSTNGQTRR